MNSRDRLNLDFILNTDSKQFDEWIETVGADDIDYALELIRRAKVEKTMEMIELQDLMAEYEDEMDDAKHIINRIKTL